jgi:hypothetical protein
MKFNASVSLHIARNLILAAFAAGVVSVGMADLVMGCGSPQKTAAVVVDSGSLALCVLQHSTEPVSQVVVECAGATESLVTTLLSEHKAAAAREVSARLRDGGKG